MTDQQPTALALATDAYTRLGVPDAPRVAAALLAQHARELAEQTHQLARERGAEMRARGDRSRVAYCAGIHAARRQLTEYADRLDGGEQPTPVAVPELANAAADEPPATCGRIRGFMGGEFPPCARPAGHRHAYCRSADGKSFFLAADPS